MMRSLLRRLEEASGELYKLACEINGVNYASKIQDAFGGVIAPGFGDVVVFPSRHDAEPAIAKLQAMRDAKAAEKAQALANRQKRRAGGRRYSTSQDDAGRGGGGMGF